MKILLALHGYPPGSVGGAELHAEALARELARDHDVAVLFRTADPGRRDLDVERSGRDGVRQHALNNLQQRARGFESYRHPDVTARCLEVLDTERPDVLHVHHLNGLSTDLVTGARARRIPVVMTLHDFATLCPLGQLLTLDLHVCPGPEARRCLGCVGGSAAVAALGAFGGGRLAGLAGALTRGVGLGRGQVAERLTVMRELLGSVDLLVSPSRFLRDRMAAFGIRGVEVVANGHEPLASRKRLPDPEGHVRFGYVGSVIPSKGVHVLAEAWRRLADPRARLSILGPIPAYHGDEGYEDRLRGILGAEADTVLRGSFPHADLPDVLAQFDVLVIPSLWEENAPLTLSEAFLAGLPPVVSDHGGLAEAVRDGVDGLRVPAGDSQALAAALRQLVEDAALRKRLAAAAPAVPTLADHMRLLLPLYQRARRRA